MLTTTFALLSLSMEQKKLHASLSSSQHFLQHNLNHQRLDVVTLKSIVKKFSRLAALCRKSRVEIYVIPALQKVTHQLDRRLAEMDTSKVVARQTLMLVKSWVKSAEDATFQEMTDLQAAIEWSCGRLKERLTMEEDELLPLAQRVIPNDQWFSMGAQFLAAHSATKAHYSFGRIESIKLGSGNIMPTNPLISPAISRYADTQ